MGPFVGVVETLCGSVLLLGLLTRLAALPLIIDMRVAIISTRIPILLGHGFWWRKLKPSFLITGFGAWPTRPAQIFARLLGSIFLLVVGGGSWSIDRRLTSKANEVDG